MVYFNKVRCNSHIAARVGARAAGFARSDSWASGHHTEVTQPEAKLPIYRTLVSEMLEKVIKREGFLSYPANHLHDLQRDFEIILANVEDLQLRADRVMNVVTAVMSIEESKKAVE